MKITHGKYFRTRAGKYGRYKYHNGKKHSFVTSRSKSTYSKRRY